LADKYGRFNVLIIAMIVTTILVLGMWIPVSSNAGLIVFAGLFGFTSGCIVSVIPACVAQLSDVRQIGVRTGTLFTFVAIAVLVGSPIGGQLIILDNGGFVKLQVFSGVMMAAGCVPFIALRMIIAEMKLKVKV
jgi:MFS family permease